MSVQDRLLSATRSKVVGPAAYLLLKLLGVEFPRSVQWVGPVELAHGAVGLVVHSETRFGSNIMVLPGVVLGRSDPWIAPETVAHLGGGIEVGDEVILGAGAKVLFSPGQTLSIATGTVVGANAVLRHSTRPWEIWAGNPAVRVSSREPDRP